MSQWVKACEQKPREVFTHGRESKNVLIAFKDSNFEFWFYDVAYYAHSDCGGHWMSASRNCIAVAPDYWKYITPPEIEPI